MTKPSNAIDIRPAAAWLMNPLVSTEERIRMSSLFFADTNNDGFLEKPEFETSFFVYSEDHWSALKGEFLKFSIWQNWLMTNTHLFAKIGKVQSLRQTCSDLSQEVGPPFYGTSTTGFSAKVLCGYTQSTKFGRDDLYDVLTERVYNLPHNKRLQVLQTALNAVDKSSSYSDAHTIFEVAGCHLTATEYATFFKHAMQNANPYVRNAALHTNLTRLPTTERVACLLMGLEDRDEDVRCAAIVFRLGSLPESDRLTLVTAASKSRYADVRYLAIEFIDAIPKHNRLPLLQSLAEDDNEDVRHFATHSLDFMNDPSNSDRIKEDEVWALGDSGAFQTLSSLLR